MTAPRFLLREHGLKKIFSSLPRGRVLEIGYGDGKTLILLSKLGFDIAGYDFSSAARTAAETNIREAGLAQKIRLLTTMDESQKYDYLVFFEVIGYWHDPVLELQKLNKFLNPGGAVVFSFTNKQGEGAAEKYTGNMRCFYRQEIVQLLKKASLSPELIWNYGFPLTAVMRPVLHAYYQKLHETGRLNDTKAAVEESGLAHKKRLLVRVASLLLNRWTLAPFCLLQMFFKNSTLGSGYIVVSRLQA